MVTGFYFIVFALSLILMIRILTSNKKVDVLLAVSVILVTINCLGRYLLATAETLEVAIWANKVIYVGSLQSRRDLPPSFWHSSSHGS